MRMTRERLESLRKQYPAGTRIMLREMADDPNPVPSGTMGTVQGVDDAGQLLMKWDNGRTLSLIVGKDSFSALPSEPTMMKLYMPLTAELYYNEEGQAKEDHAAGGGIPLDGKKLVAYRSDILNAMEENCVPEETERGIMYWYNKEGDSVDQKVKSVTFAVENRDGKLWGIAECQVVGKLTSQEMSTLKDFIEGQASNGWGAVFDEVEIDIGRDLLYVHLYGSENWRIMTEEECFGPQPTEKMTNTRQMGGMMLE